MVQGIGEAVSEEIRAQEIGEAVSEEIVVQRKCTRQFVLIAKMNVKFPLSHQETDLFTAETVIVSTRGSKFIFLDTCLDTFFFILFFFFVGNYKRYTR